MNEKLGALLNKYDQQQDQAKTVREHRKTVEQQFIEAFTTWRATIAKPTLERVKHQLEARGHKVEIEMQDGPPTRAPNSTDPAPLAISLSVQLHRASQHAFTDPKPTIQYAALPDTQVVMGWRSTVSRGGGVSGPFGKFALQALDAATLETHVVDWFSAVVN